MDSNVVEKCLTYCQALVTAIKTFSLNLSINLESFVFANKEQTKSSCIAKKKSPSQVRREERRITERDSKKYKVTENVAEYSDSKNYVSKTPNIYSCNHCEVNFKTEEKKFEYSHWKDA